MTNHSNPILHGAGAGGMLMLLLERRPDVRAAEQQVRVAHSAIGVAVGNFFRA